jgi:hypothetical protein
MIYRRYFLLLLFALQYFVVNAQFSQDAGGWWNANVGFELKHNRTFYVNPEIRQWDNFRSVRSAFTDIGVQQKWGKNVTGILEYRVGGRNDWTSWGFRHRISLGLAGKMEFKKWEIGVTVRQQLTQSSFSISDAADLDTKTTTRIKGGLKYKVNKDWEIYQSHELFFHSQFGQYTNWRWQTGVGYDLSKNQSIKLGYLIQRDLSNLATDYIVTGGWSYDFKFKKEGLKKGEEKKSWDQLNLMNGRVINCEVFMDTSLLVKVRYQGRYGKWKEAEFHRNEIFSVMKGGKETLVYERDTLLGYYDSSEEMRIFLMGEQDAKERYKARHTMIGGFLICGTLAFLGQDGVFTALIPPIAYTLAHIPGRIKVRKHHLRDEALRYNDLYGEGFGSVSKSRRIVRAAASGFIGSTVGVLLYFISK